MVLEVLFSRSIYATRMFSLASRTAMSFCNCSRSASSACILPREAPSSISRVKSPLWFLTGSSSCCFCKSARIWQVCHCAQRVATTRQRLLARLRERGHTHGRHKTRLPSGLHQAQGELEEHEWWLQKGLEMELEGDGWQAAATSAAQPRPPTRGPRKNVQLEVGFASLGTAGNPPRLLPLRESARGSWSAALAPADPQGACAKTA